jgi:hypothetical protein
VRQNLAVAKFSLAVVLTTAASSVFAQGNALVLGQSLAIAGCVGGACAGSLAALFGPHRLRFWPSFGVYIGLLSVTASTWAGTMDIVPLTLVLGALAGLLPYAACFYLACHALTRLRAAIQRHRAPSE